MAWRQACHRRSRSWTAPAVDRSRIAQDGPRAVRRPRRRGDTGGRWTSSRRSVPGGSPGRPSSSSAPSSWSRSWSPRSRRGASRTPRRSTSWRSSWSRSSPGRGPAVVAAIGSFLAYDFLFVEPQLHADGRRPAGVAQPAPAAASSAIVVGRLAGRERDRAEAAIAREREAERPVPDELRPGRGPDALDGAARRSSTLMVGAVRSRRVWIEVADRVVADSGSRTHARRRGARRPGAPPGRPAGRVGPRPRARRGRRRRSSSRRTRAAVSGRDRRPASATLGPVVGGAGARRRCAVGGRDPGPGRRRRPDRAGRWSATAWPRRRRPPRSRAAATCSSRPCSTRCRTTCAPRWPRSAPRPGTLMDPRGRLVARRAARHRRGDRRARPIGSTGSSPTCST